MEQEPRALEPRAPFTIGLIQDHATADAVSNLQRTERLVREAARKGAQIVCLKELFQSPIARPQATLDQYAVTRDGQRFLFIQPKRGQDSTIAPITVVVNWSLGAAK